MNRRTYEHTNSSTVWTTLQKVGIGDMSLLFNSCSRNLNIPSGMTSSHPTFFLCSVVKHGRNNVHHCSVLWYDDFTPSTCSPYSARINDCTISWSETSCQTTPDTSINSSPFVNPGDFSFSVGSFSTMVDSFWLDNGILGH